MPSILIVEKSGTLKKVSAKTLSETDFYKKAGFKTNEGFQKHTTWKLNIDETDYNICLYGKTNGRANTENKYDFPPPVDSILFFGNCVLANIVNGEIRELDEDDWGTIYEYLFGGFEDLGDDDSSETNTEDELAETGLQLTKDGYAKDGFIVDDDEEDDEFEDDDEDDDVSSEDSIPKKRRAPAKRTTSTKKSAAVPKKPKNAFVEPVVADPDEVNDVLDCTSELSEESYM